MLYHIPDAQFVDSTCEQGSHIFYARTFYGLILLKTEMIKLSSSLLCVCVIRRLFYINILSKYILIYILLFLMGHKTVSFNTELYFPKILTLHIFGNLLLFHWFISDISIFYIYKYYNNMSDFEYKMLLNILSLHAEKDNIF